ncbi:MAG: LamG domain-containing protein, partial [Proteobacteria bacterium]
MATRTSSRNIYSYSKGPRIFVLGLMASLSSCKPSSVASRDVATAPALASSSELVPGLPQGPLQNAFCELISKKNPGSLVGCYPMDGNAGDGSSLGNHGQIKGAVQFSKLGTSEFAAFTGGFIQIPKNSSLPKENDARTFALWIYTEKGSWKMDEHTILHSGGFLLGPRKTFAIDMHTSPQMQISIWDNDFFFEPKVALEGWFHLSAVYDPSSRKMRAYVNGEFIGTKDDVKALETPDMDYFIGSSKDGKFPFLGKIDDLL